MVHGMMIAEFTNLHIGEAGSSWGQRPPFVEVFEWIAIWRARPEEAGASRSS